MTSKKTFLLFAMLFVFVIAGFLWWPLVRTQLSRMSVDTPRERPAETFQYQNASTTEILVELPFPGAVTGKEFSVLGKARGFWFFEASFPVVLLDENGVELDRGIAVAQGEWMTTEFVPFRADMTVKNRKYIGPATLILHKDNPSGESSRDASVSFPITIEY